MNFRASVKVLQQQVEALAVNLGTSDHTNRLIAAYREDEHRYRIRQSGDSDAIRELEALELRELKESLCRRLEQAEEMEAIMQSHPDGEFGSSKRERLAKALVKDFSIGVMKGLNKLLGEELPATAFDQPLYEIVRNAITQLRKNKYAYLD